MKFKLTSFKRKSSFRRWLYRIIANHVINMKKRRARWAVVSFDQPGRSREECPITNLPDPKSPPVDLPLLLEEIKNYFRMGILLCLDREHRLIFVFNDIYEVGDIMGSKIFDISRANYRKKVSRARNQVYRYMKARFGILGSC